MTEKAIKLHVSLKLKMKLTRFFFFQVFLYEPWRNIDNLQFPQADDPCPQTDILHRSTVLHDQLADTDGFVEKVSSQRCCSSCSSSSDSSDTLVWGASDRSLYWSLRDQDADSSHSGETIIVNGDLDVTREDQSSSAQAGQSGLVSIIQDSSISWQENDSRFCSHILVLNWIRRELLADLSCKWCKWQHTKVTMASCRDKARLLLYWFTGNIPDKLSCARRRVEMEF